MESKQFITAIPSEEYILSALLVDASLMGRVIGYISSAEQMFCTLHRKIYGVMLRCYESGNGFDLASIVNEIPDEMRAITSLSIKGSSGGRVEEHCQNVFEAYTRKELSLTAQALSEKMFEQGEDVMDAINEFKAKQEELFSFANKEERHIRDAIKDMRVRFEELKKGGEGIPTGFTYFDEFSGGIQYGDLMILAGETSNGKTTLGINILQNAAEIGVPSAVFSYEMTCFQLTARMVSYKDRLISKDIIRAEMDSTQLQTITNNVTKLSNSPLYIIKPFGTNFSRLLQDIIRIHHNYKTKLFLIDYLQLLSNSKRNASTADTIAEMVNKLKAIAVELNIAIIVVSQLSRSHGSPRPTLARLKGSGDIENAADVVMFSYLPYKHGIEDENVNGKRVEIGENGIIVVAKGRNIGTTEFVLGFRKEVPAFYNYKINDSDDFYDNLSDISVNGYMPESTDFE